MNRTDYPNGPPRGNPWPPLNAERPIENNRPMFIFFPEFGEYRPIVPVRLFVENGDYVIRILNIRESSNPDLPIINAEYENTRDPQDCDTCVIDAAMLKRNNIYPRLIKDDELCRESQKKKDVAQVKQEQALDNVKTEAALSRRSLLKWGGVGVIAAGLLGGAASTLITSYIDGDYERGKWDADFDHWKAEVRDKDVKNIFITKYATDRMRELGITFEGNAIVLPDGDHIFSQRDADHTLDSARLEVMQNGEELLVYLRQFEERGQTEAVSLTTITRDGTRSEASQGTFAHWSDGHRQDGAEIHVFNSLIAEKLKERGIRFGTDGEIITKYGARISIRSMTGPDWEVTQIRCEYRPFEDSIRLQVYEFNPIEHRNVVRFIRIDPNGNIVDQ